MKLFISIITEIVIRKKFHGMSNFHSIILVLLIICSNAIFAQWGYIVPPDPWYGANYLVDDGNDLYLATNGDVYKSTDNGNSWINLSNGS